MISSSAINRLVDLKVQNSQFRNSMDAESQRFDQQQKSAMLPVQQSEAMARLSSMKEDAAYTRRKRRNEALSTGMF